MMGTISTHQHTLSQSQYLVADDFWTVGRGEVGFNADPSIHK